MTVEIARLVPAGGGNAFRRGEPLLLLKREIHAEHERCRAQQREARNNDRPCDGERRASREHDARDEGAAPAEALHGERRRDRRERDTDNYEREGQRSELRRRRELAAHDPAEQEHRHHPGGRETLRQRKNPDGAHALR